MKRLFAVISTLVLLPTALFAQVGEYRNVLSVGGSAGYVMSNVTFVPKVTQRMHGGLTAGFSMRYTCEKYFSTICSVAAEVNFAQIGWKEDILDIDDQPLLIAGMQTPMEYERTINYIQVPIFAHLAWGREEKGFNAFINLGPQLGVMLGESTATNFDANNEQTLRNPKQRPASNVIAQHKMPVENTFDFGIAVGAGLEYSHPSVGHFLLDARYYYGLGNIYGDSKRDFFGRSAFGNIVIKAGYLFDL